MTRAADAAAILLSLLISVPACWGDPILQETARIVLPEVKGRIDHLAADIDGRRLFVAALGNGTVEVVDVDAKKAVHSLTGFREPQGLLVMPGAARLVITDGQADHATIVDTAKLASVGEVPLPEDGDNVRLELNNGSVWVGVGSGRTSALLVVDPVNGKVVKRIGLRGHPESFQIEQQGQRIFVNVPTAQAIQVLDRQRGSVIVDWRVPAAANFPMALDERSQRLFVGTRTPASLIVYDTASGKPVTSVAAVGDTDDVFYDSSSRRLYVSGGEGSVQVFRQDSADRYSLVETVPTRKGARTSLFVPEWRMLFVAVPRYGQDPAEIRVFSVAP